MIGMDASVILQLDNAIGCKDLKPWHIVSLACLCEYARRCVSSLSIKAQTDVIDYMRDDLSLDKYFGGGKRHIDSARPAIFNLWQIDPQSAIIYSNSLSRYLKQEYFKGKDISMVQTMLDELYANVGDHSRSDGMAYSYVYYNEECETIEVAFCDFGIGIPESLRMAGLMPPIGVGYIQYATQRGVSIRSNTHNAGFGLSTVLDCMEGSNHYLRIISNGELYYHLNLPEENKTEKTFALNKPFGGTLIYYGLDISQFPDEEIIGSGDLLSDIDW